MGFKAVVFHKGGLAHYTISNTPDGRFQALLFRYDGRENEQPPKVVEFVKDGRHCSGDTAQELMDELFAAVDNRIKKLSE